MGGQRQEKDEIVVVPVIVNPPIDSPSPSGLG